MSYMKNFVLLLTAAFLLDNAWSQDWQPINSTEKFSYKLGASEMLVNSIKVESAYENVNGDSVFYFNRILSPCIACNPEDFNANGCWNAEQIFLNNQRQFLGDSVVVANGIWNFFGAIEFMIQPNAPAGDVFTYSNEPLIIATVDSITEGSVLGVTDSLKYIGLDNGTTIILSKEHGLTSMPDSTGSEQYNLCGISNRHLGEYELTFEEAFDFEVGDVLFYQSSGGSSIGSHHITTRRDILEIEEVQDSVHITALVTSYYALYGFINPLVWGYLGDSSGTGNHEYGYSKNHCWSGEDHRNAQLDLSSFNASMDDAEEVYNLQSFGSDAFSRLAIDQVGNRKTVEFNTSLLFTPITGTTYGATSDPTSKYCIGENSDTILYIEDNVIPGFALSYGQGLGITTSSYWDGLSSSDIRLVGYVKGTDTVGVYYNAQELLAMSVLERDIDESISVFPNPTSDELNIVQAKATMPFSYKIFNTHGQMLMSGTAMKSIDVAALTSGSYLLTTDQQGKTGRTRFVVMK